MPKLLQIKLVPGKKLCRKCRAKVNNVDDDLNDNVIDPEILEINEEFSTEVDKKALNEMFSTIGMSPIKIKGLHDSGKLNQGKKKMSTLLDIVKCKVAKVFKLPVESFEEEKINNEIIEKAEMFDELKDVITSKLQVLNSCKEKIQVMTLVPTNWPITKVTSTS